MSFENTAGLNVNTHYGLRNVGGVAGPLDTDGYKNQYGVDLPPSGLINPYPVGAEIFVSEVDLTYVVGTITHIAIGGVAVFDSTTPVVLPVNIPALNTGVVVITGGTGGRVFLNYKNTTTQ